jgi:hypothetical protein
VELFGADVPRVLTTLQEEIAKQKVGESSELIGLLVGRVWSDRFGEFTGDPAHRPGEHDE